MLNNLRNKVVDFIDSKKETPIIAALAAGLYPLLYYYDKNFTLVNSWSQFFFFAFIYILIPAVSFYLLYKFFFKTSFLKKYSGYILPVLNLSIFTFLIILSTFGFDNKENFLLLLIPIALGVLLKKHFKKVIVFQLLLSCFVFSKLLPNFHRHLTYSSAWMQQPDTIEEVLFKKRPNVYIIQPDGYANFAELNKSNYNYDNSKFESFLVENNFKLYPNYRSNYSSTLSSNSSMFSMKHHYFHEPKPGMNELYNARDIIVGKNPVISIFKKNNYKTLLLLEKPYLLLNRPEIEYDYSNLINKEVSYLSKGNVIVRDLVKDLETSIISNAKTNNFYFIEKIKPGHIANYKSGSKGADIGRLNYLKELEESNVWLKQTIDIITKNDSNSLIVVVADHGGFVGMDYTSQSKVKQTERDLVYTIFTSALAIKWPNQAPNFDDKLKTNVNLFRILFAYLSENEQYLEHLQEDKSYTIIEKKAPFGVYELINEEGEVVFNKIQF
ncbi:hypothetical protein Q4512_15280 [Oceanihabitans sp. 2_MG-2023]|uniref:hypothetical protein n=1 Tax=Oceanihabitans sp. 2_MG-2023 TaxID=3062661 RepID=UPI0026E1934F|nr:hypothetical protein [Oceanihabitans sp. 2_MG-2023]MDO6598285.1 hypothetical protein [Oceanihabitans sp. 2_MG-2023]